jgi:hypothetical protein
MWFTKKQHSKATKDAICAAFPEHLRDDALVALDNAEIAAHEPSVDHCNRSLVEGILLSIPYRVYFPRCHIETLQHLTERERTIYACIMTRHHDGHEREYWARILCASPTTWTAPFVAMLLGDYVIQVLTALRDSITPAWLPIMSDYASQNKICLRSLNHRILNYWTLYYRYYSPNIRILTDYPGYSIANKLGLWDRRTAPKLLRKSKKAN